MKTISASLSVCLTAALWPAAVLAQGDAPQPADAAGSVTTSNVLSDFYDNLGPIFFPVFLLMSIVFVALLVMGILAVRRGSFVPSDLIAGVDESLAAGDTQAAVDLVRNDESFLGQIVASGLARLPQGKQPAMEAMQITGEDEVMKLEHKLGYLALIGNIAPLVGLLGTVAGMITSFGVIANSTQTPKPAELAGGIQTALYTTLVGLILAIPAIIAYNLLKTRMQRMVAEAGGEGELMLERFGTVSVAPVAV